MLLPPNITTLLNGTGPIDTQLTKLYCTGDADWLGVEHIVYQTN